jgi:hypothetical protein
VRCMMWMRLSMLGRTLAVVGAAGTISWTAGPAPAAQPETKESSGSPARAAACTPASNVEAIVDDSRSMRSSDPNNLRRDGVQLFVSAVNVLRRENVPVPQRLGVVEFGSQADTVLAPGPIPSDGLDTGAIGALEAKVSGDGAEGPTASGVDDGFGTDYNDAFARAAVDNPAADARIFLTDGAHNENEYAQGHRGGPRTFVVGLGIGAADPSNVDANRLDQIARETGGEYFPDADEQADISSVFEDMLRAMMCQRPLVTLSMPFFTASGQATASSFKPPIAARVVTLSVTWAESANRFSIAGLRALDKRGRTVATASGKGRPRKLRVSRGRGETFQTLAVRPVRGMRRLRFTIKASRVQSSETPIVKAGAVSASPRGR